MIYLLNRVYSRHPGFMPSWLFTLLMHILLVAAVLALVVLIVRRVYRMRRVMRCVGNAVRDEKRLPDVIRASVPVSQLPTDPDVGGRQYIPTEYNSITRQIMLPDPYCERQYPYYQRTRIYLGDTVRYTPNSLADGSWYGTDEWLRDVISGAAVPPED